MLWRRRHITGTSTGLNGDYEATMPSDMGVDMAGPDGVTGGDTLVQAFSRDMDAILPHNPMEQLTEAAKAAAPSTQSH